MGNVGKGNKGAGAAKLGPTPWHILQLRIDELHAQGITGREIMIAVVDTGIDTTMPIFSGNPNVSSIELTGAPGTDHDGHGTRMAAIMVGNGIATAPGATVLGISAFASSTWSVSYLVLGIHQAVAMGAQVISISGGLSAPDDELDKAILDATSAGIVVVAAGSNDSGSALQYPANVSPTIAVTRSNKKNALVIPVPPGVDDVAAPGSGIPTVDFDTPTLGNGTSEATAIVASISALLLSAVPNSRRAELGSQLRGFLKTTTIPATNAGGPNNCGIVQPVAALAAIRSWL